MLGTDAGAASECGGKLQFVAFDFSIKNYPRSRVSALPNPPARLRAGSTRDFPSAFDRQDRLMFQRGRYALHEGMRLAGVAPGEAVLLPAYHCRTMVDPALSIGARILLYPLTDDLAPDFDALSQMIGERPPKAMVLPHYFGFPQDLGAAKAFCDAHDLRLIEDCAHAFFGRWQDSRLGEVGDYAVASLPKFFAHDEGGVLIGCGDRMPHSGSPPVRGARAARFVSSAKALARYAKHSLEHTVTLKKLETASSTSGIGETPDDVDIIYETDRASSAYDASRAVPANSLLVTQILRLTDRRHLIEKRRDNYRQWQAALADCPGCEPLFGSLPDDVVPYMFPLRVDDPQPVFEVLKRSSLPIFRWDELAASTCAVSSGYRLGLFQLPCHQSLSSDEMQWLTQTVHHVLSGRRL